MHRLWHIITCEYPDDTGGVSDYTFHLAQSLAEDGCSVHVWCPGKKIGQTEQNGITVHRELGKVGIGDLSHVGKLLNQFPFPRNLLVQWVPHGYGYRSMNIPFCLWLWKRASRNKDRIDLMVHEPFLPFQEGNWKQNFASSVQRFMARTLLKAANRAWITASAWKKVLLPLFDSARLKMEWLTVASNIPVAGDTQEISNLRERFAPNGLLIGHFGTFDRLISNELHQVLPQLVELEPTVSILLFGKGSNDFWKQLVKQYPTAEAKIHPLGQLSPEATSAAIAACDLLVQPYTEGANSRRTTLMAGLAHGIPIVSTYGPLTDPIWLDNPVIAMVPAGDSLAMIVAIQQLLRNPGERSRLGQAGRSLYQERFDWRHIVTALQQAQ